MTLERMLVEDTRYRVLMSRSLYRWLVYDATGAALSAGVKGWTQGGRVSFSRMETLHARLKAVSFEGEGRMVRLAQRDARSVIALIELWRSLGLDEPPRSSRSLVERLRWQVGDVDRLPGVLPEQVRSMHLIPAGPGLYVSQGDGIVATGEGS